MSALTVDEILAERPSLRARAKAAHAEAAAARAREYRVEASELHYDTIATLRDTFGVTEAELAGIDFEEKPYNPSTPSLIFELDDLTLRTRYLNVLIMTKKSSEYGEEKIYDRQITVETSHVGSWKTARDLESLGLLV